MNTHKNARLTYARRLELVMDVLERDLSLCAAAAAHNVSVPTARKWVGRYLAEGAPGLAECSSRPRRSPRGNRLGAQAQNRSARYGVGSTTGASPATISATSRPVTAASVRP